MKWVGMEVPQWSHVPGEMVNMCLSEMKPARTQDDLLCGDSGRVGGG